MNAPNLYLVGLRGAGKSGAGHVIARRLGRAFVDTDDLIVARAGKSIARIFADDGEPAFRDLEAAAIADVAATGGQVVATGGGIVLRDANVAAMRRSGCVVHLDASPEALHARLVRDTAARHERPAPTAARGSLEDVRLLHARRAPLYAAARHAVVSSEVDGLGPLVDAIMAAFAAFGEEPGAD